MSNPATDEAASISVRALRDLVSKQGDLNRLRRVVREFLAAIDGVPMRAVDCDQERVDALHVQLVAYSGYKR